MIGSSRFEALQSLLAGTATVAAIAITQATAVAMTAREIARIAVPVTVQINDNADGGGSGVIIARAGNTYTVLTVNHVVKRPDLTYTIRTHTGKIYPVNRVQQLQPIKNGPDLAVVTFVSPDKYPSAALGNSEQAVLGSDIYISGYPALAGHNRDYEFSPGIVTSRPRNAPNGYDLRYNAVTVSGMSGSPVFDTSGRVVGIHGVGENEGSAQSESGGTIAIKTGFNSAIPINTFVELKAQTGLIGSQVRVNNTPPSTQAPRHHPPDARDYARGLSRFNPSDTLVYYKRGNIQPNLGYKQVAIRNYTQAIQRNPQDGPAYYNRAQARYVLGDKEGAEKDYTQAVRLNPNFALAYNNLGMTRYEIGDKQGAIKAYTQAIRLSPRFALAYNNLGMVRYDLGDKRGAIRDYTEAIRFFPNYATAYYNLGVVHYQLGQKQAAVKDYTQAIRLNHNYTLAYYNRGVVRQNLGDKQGALEDFQQAAKIYQQEGNKGEYQHVLTKIKQLQHPKAR